MRKFALSYFVVVLVVCFATWLIWALFDYPLTGIDDANIFFVYARNVASGHGFVYNVGGERVEGFSSLLWTLICTVAFSLSSTPELMLLIVNILIASLGITVALSYIGSELTGPNDNRFTRLFLQFVFLSLLVTSPAYILWNTITLMENALWGTLLLLATVLVTRNNVSTQATNFVLAFVFILILLTRPESFVWVAVFTSILFVRKALANGLARAMREIVPLLLVIATTVAALTLFRSLYFGYPLPNTYYAKVSPSMFYNFTQGAIYFAKYFTSSPVVSISIVAAALTGMHAVLSFMENRSVDDGLAFLPVVAGVGLMIPMITGGDHFSSFRFYQSIYPILLLCLIYFVRSVLPHYIQIHLNPVVVKRPQMIFMSSLGILFVFSFVLYQARDWLSSEETDRMEQEFAFAADGREQGQFMEDLFSDVSELPKLGVVRAGGIKYTYMGEVVDLMGLNNLSMAHNGGKRVGRKNHAAFEKSTFYQLKPDVVSAELVSKNDWHYEAVVLRKSWDNTVALKGLYDDTAFQESYVYAKIERKGTESNKCLVGWFQKDFLNELDQSGEFVIERFSYGAID